MFKPGWLSSLAMLATTLLAAPAFAQPGVQDPSAPTIDDRPVPAGATVVIVSPPPQAPGQAAPADPHAAPHNEPWSNVSHINGQIVKVGERSDYLYKWKTTNIASNPIGWMFGFYGLSISTAVHDNVAIRGDANIISFENESGYEVGLSVPLYFRRVYSGPFLEAGVVARNLSNTGDAHVGPEVLFGWHWTFDSGFNVAVALGAMRNLDRDPDDYNDGNAEPAGYFRIGYAM